VLGAMVRLMPVLLSHRSPWIGVPAGGILPARCLARARTHCKFARRSMMSRSAIAMNAVWHWHRVFLRKPYIQPTGAAPALLAVSAAGAAISSQQAALELQSAVLLGHRDCVSDGLGRCAIRAGGWWWRTVGDTAAAARAMGISVDLVRSFTTTIGGFLSRRRRRFFSRCRTQAPGNQGLFVGTGADGGWPLVIFARWNPLRCRHRPRCCSAALARSARPLQSVGITQGYYFFNAAPYIPHGSFIMIATSSAQTSARRHARRTLEWCARAMPRSPPTPYPCPTDGGLGAAKTTARHSSSTCRRIFAGGRLCRHDGL